MSRFGTTVGESAGQGDYGTPWIKGFKDPSTRIRFVDELDTWKKYRHHYWGAVRGGYFPCARRYDNQPISDCIGCNHPDEKTQSRSWQAAFHALDEQGRLNIFRLGAGSKSHAYKILKGRFDRLGTITDRDYTINKIGKGLDTTYDPEPGEKYHVDLPTELFDIWAILEEKYGEAEHAWKVFQDGESEPEPERPVTPKVEATALHLKKPETEESEAAKRAVLADLGQTEPEVKDTPSKPDFEDMTTPELKAYLEANNIPFDGRKGRAYLIDLAEAGF